MRGETPQGDRPPLVLPRARVLLTLLLPTASEPGPYEVEIRDFGALSKASAREKPVSEIRSPPLRLLWTLGHFRPVRARLRFAVTGGLATLPGPGSVSTVYLCTAVS